MCMYVHCICHFVIRIKMINDYIWVLYSHSLASARHKQSLHEANVFVHSNPNVLDFFNEFLKSRNRWNEPYKYTIIK